MSNSDTAGLAAFFREGGAYVASIRVGLRNGRGKNYTADQYIMFE
jgi:hypothetical protein